MCLSRFCGYRDFRLSGLRFWDFRSSGLWLSGFRGKPIQTLPYGHWQIGLYKCLVTSEISSEKAEERAMKANLHVEA